MKVQLNHEWSGAEMRTTDRYVIGTTLNSPHAMLTRTLPVMEADDLSLKEMRQ